jgi:hypothetical protein
MNRYKTFLFSVLCLFSFLPLSTSAQFDIRQTYSPHIEGEILYIRGKIDSHIYDFLSYNYQQLKSVRYVSVNSYGGNHDWSLEIARKLRELKLSTLLERGNVCASACLYIFGAGIERVAHHSTWFGIHGARLGKGSSMKFINACYSLNPDGKTMGYDPTKLGCQNVYQELYELCYTNTLEAFLTLEQNGVSTQLFEDYLSLEEEINWSDNFNFMKIRDWELQAQEAEKYHLVTKRIYEN